MATKQINKIAREKEGMVIIMMIIIMDVVLNKKWHLEKTIELVLGTYFFTALVKHDDGEDDMRLKRRCTKNSIIIRAIVL